MLHDFLTVMVWRYESKQYWRRFNNVTGYDDLLFLALTFSCASWTRLYEKRVARVQQAIRIDKFVNERQASESTPRKRCRGTLDLVVRPPLSSSPQKVALVDEASHQTQQLKVEETQPLHVEESQEPVFQIEETQLDGDSSDTKVCREKDQVEETPESEPFEGEVHEQRTISMLHS